MAGIVALEDKWQEAFTWQLHVDEAEEKAAHLELDLEIVRAQKEQAEAKLAALELRVQPRKKEGSKEIRRLLAAEAEKTRAIERLVAEETKRGRQREEKLREMQKRLAAWEKKSPEPDIGQTGEQKEARQRLEVSKNLIAALQEEIRDQAEQIETMHENEEIWWERSEQAERLVVELREKLTENHTQAEETRKAITKEMEKVKEYMSSYEALEAQKQSLEARMKAKIEEHIKLQAQCQRGVKELETKMREAEELRAQLKKGAVEKDLCEEQVQHLKALLEERSGKEAAIDTEREQLRQQMQTSKQQVQALEEEIKRFQEERQSLKALLRESTAREAMLQQENEQQLGLVVQAQKERLTGISRQLEEHLIRAKGECEGHLQEFKGLQEALTRVERAIEIALVLQKQGLCNQEQTEEMSTENPKEGREPEQLGKNVKMEVFLEADPTGRREGIISIVMECLNQTWGQWTKQYAEDMKNLKERLDGMAGRHDPGVLAVPKKHQQMEVDKGKTVTGQERDWICGKKEKGDPDNFAHTQKGGHMNQKDQRSEMAHPQTYTKQEASSKREEVIEPLRTREAQRPGMDRRGRNPEGLKGGGEKGLKLHPKMELSSPAQQTGTKMELNGRSR
ncbi:golgin subfamily A member 6-like protein 24 [Alligator mississippiensis]|uniref:golgin subfamily A member 6-like protein 24 n=1 Tax=Alligator mississippiensis TaxID=8496 RepID=UPI002878140F|nr:golgin subfamily A member 6-like protein 24 [Alligator mississippiensis]